MSTAELRALVPRVISKLENDELDEALKLAEQNTKVAAKISPLRCYINYKRQQYQRVIEIHKGLHNNVQRELGMLHLLGQTHYKLGLKTGNFTEAVHIYAQIGELYPHESLQSAEYVVNALAAYVNGFDMKRAKALLASVDFASVVQNSAQSPLHTYETLFNSSFVSMQEWDLDVALVMAEKAYHTFQIENGSSPDINEDALLQYHIAYLQNLQGKTVQFKDTVNALLNDFESFSAPVQTIFNINNVLTQLQSVTTTAVTITNNDKPHDLIKKIEGIKDEQQEKLSKTQINLINFNLAIFHALQRSQDQIQKTLNLIPTDRITDPSSPTTKAITTLAVPNPDVSATGGLAGFHKEWMSVSLQIYCHLKEKDYNKCDDLLTRYLSSITPYLTQTSTQTYIIPYQINAILTKVFFALYRHQTNTALDLLTNLVSDVKISTYLTTTKQITNNLTLRQQPAMLALFTTLYEEAKDYQSCSGLIDEAIQLYTTHSQLSKDPNASRILSQLRVKNATIKASGGDYKGAIETLEMLANQCNKKDTAQLAQYYHYISQIVTLCTNHCPELVEKYIGLLPEPDLSDIGHYDLETFALQSTAAAAPTTKSNTTTTQSQFLINGKHKFNQEKLAQVRQKKKEKRGRKPLLPKNITQEAYLAQKAKGFPTVDSYRWKPKWERPQVNVKGKKGAQQLKQLGKGPQGSGVSENKVETNVAQGAQSTLAEKKAQIQEQMKKANNNKKGGRK